MKYLRKTPERTGRTELPLLVSMLFPPHCVFCDDVTYPECKICAECKRQVKRAYKLKRMCEDAEGNAVWCVAPYLYEGKVRDSIIRFKFYGCRENASSYAEGICEELEDRHFLQRFEMVTSVPLSKRRMRERGYNQSALVAKEVARILGIPYKELLEKHTENQVQHELDRQRRKKNVRGVYRLLSGEDVKNQGILLIDDIMTTGATLEECTQVLQKQGAAAVTCAAIAIVP